MGLLGLGFKLKNVLKPKKVSETITSLKGKYNVGSADKIKKKSNVKKLRSEIESFLGKDIYKSDAEKIAAKLKKKKSWKQD